MSVEKSDSVTGTLSATMVPPNYEAPVHGTVCGMLAFSPLNGSLLDMPTPNVDRKWTLSRSLRVHEQEDSAKRHSGRTMFKRSFDHTRRFRGAGNKIRGSKPVMADTMFLDPGPLIAPWSIKTRPRLLAAEILRQRWHQKNT